MVLWGPHGGYPVQDWELQLPLLWSTQTRLCVSPRPADLGGLPTPPKGLPKGLSRPPARSVGPSRLLCQWVLGCERSVGVSVGCVGCMGCLLGVLGCVGVSVSTPAPGHRCQCRSGATVWQLLDPRAPAGAGTGLDTFPCKPCEPSCCWEHTVPVSSVRARLETPHKQEGAVGPVQP